MADDAAPRVVDARDLPPPEPMERALEALDSLPHGGELQLWLHREPFPLYTILRNNGYRYRVAYVEADADGARFVIHIRHAGT